MLLVEAAALFVLTVLLAGPVSAALARARWPTRSPRAALVLWQAIGLAGGLGVLTAGLTLAAGSIDDDWLRGVWAIGSNLGSLGVQGWIGVALTVGMGVWLVVSAIASTLRVVRARRIQRTRVDALAAVARVGAARGDGGMLDVRLIDHPSAFAYCLPGLRPRVVLSEGATRALSDHELVAVLAHEQAHAVGRHDLVVQPFVAWAGTFPFLHGAVAGLDAVSELVEMLADDAALRHGGSEDLRTALKRLGEDAYASRAASGSRVRDQLEARMERLCLADPLPRWAAGLIYAAAAVLVVVPPLVLVSS